MTELQFRGVARSQKVYAASVSLCERNAGLRGRLVEPSVDP